MHPRKDKHADGTAGEATSTRKNTCALKVRPNETAQWRKAKQHQKRQGALHRAQRLSLKARPAKLLSRTDKLTIARRFKFQRRATLVMSLRHET